MDFWGFVSAFSQSWVAYMSGITSVVMTILAWIYSNKSKVLPSFFLGIAAIACFFMASVNVWTAEHQKNQTYLNNAEAPYVLLQHVGNQNGPAGLAVSNIGQTNAVQIQINEIRAGDRVAIFSELPVSRTDGGSSATYPIGTQSNGKPNDLDYVLDGFESDTNGDSKVTVTVDYWAVDNIRKFRTTSIFLYNKEKRSADLLHSSRELLTK